MQPLIARSYFKAKVTDREGIADGFSMLDSSGLIPTDKIPVGAQENFKGPYDTELLLIAAHPTGILGDYAYNKATKSYWCWNIGLTFPAWVNQEITDANYDLLISAAQDAVQYVSIA